MQVLDQQVALARAIPEQGCDLACSLRVDLPALRRTARPVSGSPNRRGWLFSDAH
jgi:hypothetical protein